VVAALVNAGRRDLAEELCEHLGTSVLELAQRARAEIARRAGGGPEAA